MKFLILSLIISSASVFALPGENGVKRSWDVNNVENCVNRVGVESAKACAGVKKPSDVNNVEACVNRVGKIAAVACGN